MWPRGKIIGTRWIEHKTDKTVLDEVNRRKTIMNAIIRKIKLIVTIG